MSKSALKKFSKNKYYDEGEGLEDAIQRSERRHQRRFDRALRTKDITSILEEEELDEYEAHVSHWDDIKDFNE